MIEQSTGTGTKAPPEPWLPRRRVLQTGVIAAVLHLGVGVAIGSWQAILTAVVVLGLVAGLLVADRLRRTNGVEAEALVAASCWLVATAAWAISTDYAAVAVALYPVLAVLIVANDVRGRAQLAVWAAAGGVLVWTATVGLWFDGEDLPWWYADVVRLIAPLVPLRLIWFRLSANAAALAASIEARGRAEVERASAVAAADARSRFLANMSHEIRTPMNTVLGAAELLRDREDGEGREHLDEIRNAGEHLLGVINDVLDVSRLDAGQLRLAPEDFQLDDLFEDALALVRVAASGKGLDLRLERDPALPAWVRGDRVRLRQILVNFLANAVKFTDAGEVVLEARAAGDGQVRLAVRDTGVGLAPDELSRIFERFTQVDESRTRRFPGSGLGLAIARMLADVMGGEVGAESEPGVGSTFWALLPLPSAAPPPTPAPDGREVAPLAAGHPLCVLVAEDHPTNRRVLVRLLGRLGYDPLPAATGVEARQIARERRVDLILMDLHMPEMDGLEATRRIRADDGPSADAFICALTASVMPEDRAACLMAGMDGFLSKPITAEALESVVRAAALARRVTGERAPR